MKTLNKAARDDWYMLYAYHDDPMFKEHWKVIHDGLRAAREVVIQLRMHYDVVIL